MKQVRVFRTPRHVILWMHCEGVNDELVDISDHPRDVISFLLCNTPPVAKKFDVAGKTVVAKNEENSDAVYVCILPRDKSLLESLGYDGQWALDESGTDHEEKLRIRAAGAEPDPRIMREIEFLHDDVYRRFVNAEWGSAGRVERDQG